MSFNLIIFNISDCNNEPIGGVGSNFVLSEYIIPTLSAYSIVHFEVEGIDEIQDVYGYDRLRISGDALYLTRFDSPFSKAEGLLKVYYTGIKDYSLFFSYIDCLQKRKVIGDLLEEAINAYDKSNALSFVLMAGSICEGILSEFFSTDNLGQLIAKYKELPYSTVDEINILEKLRVSRNKIHPKKIVKEGHVSRQDMVEIFTFLTKFMQKRWDEIGNIP